MEHPNHYKTMFMTSLPLPQEKVGIERHNPDQDAYAFLLRAVEEGLAQRRFRDEYGDAEELAQLLWAGVHGVAALYIAKGNDDWVELKDPARLGLVMCEAVMHGGLKP